MTVQIDVGSSIGKVSGILLRPTDAWAGYVLAHGAGAGMRHRFMEGIAQALSRRGIATLRYQFPYVESGGKRPDPSAVLEATVRAAVLAVRKGGSVTLIGNLAKDVSLPLQAVVTRQIRLQGSCASSGEYPDCLELIASGKVKVDRLISATAPLEEGPRWFDRLHRREPGLLKVLLKPNP